jgi:hypothetical protein
MMSSDSIRLYLESRAHFHQDLSHARARPFHIDGMSDGWIKILCAFEIVLANWLVG